MSVANLVMPGWNFAAEQVSPPPASISQSQISSWENPQGEGNCTPLFARVEVSPSHRSLWLPSIETKRPGLSPPPTFTSYAFSRIFQMRTKNVLFTIQKICQESRATVHPVQSLKAYSVQWPYCISTNIHFWNLHSSSRNTN